MSSRFINWYTQALGATLGVLTCIFAYVNGWMFVYGNIDTNFDYMQFDGVLSSYLLLPLCIITLCSSFIKLYNTSNKHIFKVPLNNINNFLCIITVIVGIIGTKLYFIVPMLFILEGMIYSVIQNNKNSTNDNTIQKEEKLDTLDLAPENLTNPVIDTNQSTIIYTHLPENHTKSLQTKKEMALELIQKDADIQFIEEITGLTSHDITELKRS